MMKLKSLLTACCALILGTSMATAQQEQDWSAPHWFAGVQGGIQKSLVYSYKNWQPTASAYLGYMFTPKYGARLHVNGIWDKDYYNKQRFDYRYLTTNADFLVNLCQVNNLRDRYPINVYWITGLGVYHGWDNEGINPMLKDREVQWAANGRLGVALDVPITRWFSANAEVDWNNYIHRTSNHNLTDNMMMTAQLGLNFKFCYKKKPAPEEQWATRVDTIWYDDIAYTPRVEDGTITWNVFYEIRESEFNDPDAQLKAIGAFLKDHRECKVFLKSYADVQTGNPKINMGYSQQRSEKAVKALTEAGVDPAIITAEYFGDTVQPFAENDKNRVTIIRATGLKDVKDKTTVKKFRTKEVQYRVNN